MSGFALLWSKILDSSLWVTESKETRLVWIAMLAMRDKDGVIQSSVVGLADRAKVKVEECRKALQVLLSPDKEDTSGVEQGRRIRQVPGGWQLVNHDKYRFSTEAKRELWREQKRQQRALAQAYEDGKKGEYDKRRKRVEKAGQMAGAAQAIKEGFGPIKKGKEIEQAMKDERSERPVNERVDDEAPY